MTVREDAPLAPETVDPDLAPTDDVNGAQEPTEPPAEPVWSDEPYPAEYMIPCVEWEPIPGLPDRLNTLKSQEWSALERISQLTKSPAMVAANAAELTALADQVRRLGDKADRVLTNYFSSRGF